MKPSTYKKGFVGVADAAHGSVRKIVQKRGFSDSAIIQNWEQIVGEELARVTVPKEVKFGRGHGATLVISAFRAQASELQMRLPEIKEKVNFVLGYNAVSRIRIEHDDEIQPKTPKKPAAKTKDITLPADVEADIAKAANPEIREALRAMAMKFYSMNEGK